MSYGDKYQLSLAVKEQKRKEEIRNRAQDRIADSVCGDKQFRAHLEADGFFNSCQVAFGLIFIEMNRRQRGLPGVFPFGNMEAETVKGGM